MLPPDQRQLLLDLLRPEAGYRLEQALGTTFTLDLHSLMQVPVAFLHQSGLLRGEDGELDPLSILEALRQFAKGMTVFTQAGWIKAPAKDLPRLATLLEPCVCEVRAPNPLGLFHPKVWVLRYECTSSDETLPRVRYRVLCLSRNLTFDRSWDTAVALDGTLREERTNKIRHTIALSEFVAALPGMALQPLDAERMRNVSRMAEELRKVEFELPEGFDELTFHHGGLATSRWPLPTPKERVLIVAPFINDSFVRRFTQQAEVTLVSRFEELNQLPRATLRTCERLLVMHPRAIGDDLDISTESNPDLEGLHAKVFVFDEGWHARVFSGSFNATNAAFKQNVEFMVGMRGLKSKHGVLAMVPEAKERKKGDKLPPCLGDLLEVYHVPDQPIPPDDAEIRWEDLCVEVRLAVLEAAFALHVAKQGTGYAFTLRGRSVIALRNGLSLSAWPASVSRACARELNDGNGCDFGVLTEEAITAWIGFELRQGNGEGMRRSSWLIKVPLLGAPPDREQSVLTSLIRSREDLIRFLLLMLSLDEQGPSGSLASDFKVFLSGGTTGAQGAPPLLETLLRAAHRSPRTLHRVAELMHDLRRTAPGLALEDEDLRQLWEPIWEAVQAR